MIEAIVLGLLHSLWLGALCYVVTVLVLGAVDEEHARLRAAIVALSQHALVVAVGIYGALESRPSMAAAVGPTTAFDALFAVWCVGIASSGWRLFWDLAEARRLVATSTPFAHPAFDRLIACAGNRVRVGLRLTYERVQPSVIGVLRPIILLPAACVNSLSVPELEAILAHELAHVYRRDVLHGVLMAVYRVIFFFNPFVRALCTRFALERERACDDLATTWLPDQRPLATGLLKLALVQSGNRFALSAAGECGAAELQNRARRLVNRPFVGSRRRLSGRVVLLAAVAVLVAAASLLVRGGSAHALTDRTHLVALKHAICDVLEADRIYANPRYYRGGEAELLMTEHGFRMGGQELPAGTTRSLRQLFARFGVGDRDTVHMRYLGERIRLTLKSQQVHQRFITDPHARSVTHHRW